MSMGIPEVVCAKTTTDKGKWNHRSNQYIPSIDGGGGNIWNYDDGHLGDKEAVPKSINESTTVEIERDAL